MKIPKRLGHIWIGPYKPPLEWMNTWREMHPDSEYILYDNEFLHTYNFRTQHLIDEYLKRQQYSGVADLMRYEILYEHGGLIPEADSICYHNTDELWNTVCAYTVYENELVRGALVSPILAAPPKNEFVGSIIDELCKLNKNDLDVPWRTTGNLFIARMIAELKPEIVIFPSHYFIPVHYEGIVYQGKDKIYAKQLFGTTRKSYYTIQTYKGKLNIIAKFIKKKYTKNLRKYIKQTEGYFIKKRSKLFELDFK